MQTTKRTPTLRLVYLHVNNAYIFMYGNTPTSMGNTWLHTTRASAVAAATACGLNVTSTGVVVNPVQQAA